MRIVISGATSFIGIHLIPKMLESGNEVYALIRPQSPKARLLPKCPKLRLIKIDMECYSDLDRLLPETFDSFVHLAWNGTRGANRMDKFMQEQNYQRSMEALNAALRHRCNTVMLAGSQAEYGVYNAPITEETPCRPNTEYGKWKLKLYEDAAYVCNGQGIRLLEPRFFSLYGADDFKGTMILSILEKMLKNEDCPLTACKQMWDFLYVSDAVDGIRKLLETDCAGGVYNFGSGISRPLREYVEEMARLTGTKSRLLYGAIPYGPAGVVSIEPIVSKLIQTTGGWKPTVSFDQGVLEILKALKGK